MRWDSRFHSDCAHTADFDGNRGQDQFSSTRCFRPGLIQSLLALLLRFGPGICEQAPGFLMGVVDDLFRFPTRFRQNLLAQGRLSHGWIAGHLDSSLLAHADAHRFLYELP